MRRQRRSGAIAAKVPAITARCAVNASRRAIAAKIPAITARCAVNAGRRASRSQGPGDHGEMRREPRSGRVPRPRPALTAPPAPAAAQCPPFTGSSRRPRPPARGANRARTTTSRPKAARKKNRRRPTLPGPCEPSTIGAVGLNCSVRNGKRCFPHAIATGNCARPGGPSKLHSFSTQRDINPSSPRPISTGLLRVSPRFQIRPINLVVYQGSYSFKRMGELISRPASRLDAFSGYPIRT